MGMTKENSNIRKAPVAIQTANERTKFNIFRINFGLYKGLMQL